MNKVRTSKEYSSLQLHQRIEYEGTKNSYDFNYFGGGKEPNPV
jgi:hypothetical protein